MELDFSGNGPIGHNTNRAPGINIVGMRERKDKNGEEGQLVGGIYILYIKTKEGYCLQIKIERPIETAVENDVEESISYLVRTPEGMKNIYNIIGSKVHISDEICAIISGLDEEYGFKGECETIKNFFNYIGKISQNNLTSSTENTTQPAVMLEHFKTIYGSANLTDTFSYKGKGELLVDYEGFDEKI